MQKVTAGIIRYGKCVLIMRRAAGQPLAGQWEFPGGKAEGDEKLSQCVRRELQEELGITTSVGRILASVKTQNFELFAYDVTHYSGNIELRVHDAMCWVPLWEISEIEMLPADKIIAKRIAWSRKPKESEIKRDFMRKHVLSLPRLDKMSHLWALNISRNQKKVTKYFFSRQEATNFSIGLVNRYVQDFYKTNQMRTLYRLGLKNRESL